MKNKYKLIFIVLIGLVCFLGATCGSTGTPVNPIKIESFKLGEEYYQSPYAAATVREFRDITAEQLVSEITIGWNLGNTLDTTSSETAWGNPVTAKAHIDAIKAASFNTIRIPVSWAKNTDSSFNIRNFWMDRVTEVVNYAVLNDMYIVLNTHHDEDIFKFTNDKRNASLTAFYKVWSQIAYNFRNYNEKLIFEGLNEPRTKGSGAEWSGGTFPEHLILNEHYQLFVNIVRASGGNNDKRIIMVNTYAASAEQVAMNALVIPNDTAENKIIVSIHSYAPYNFALNQGRDATNKWSLDNPNDTSTIRDIFDRAENTFIKKGYPVIMGEFGAVDRKNNDARVAWAEYFVGYARSKGIPCIIWDNGDFSRGEIFGLYNRRNNSFPYPEYLNALLRGAGVIDR